MPLNRSSISICLLVLLTGVSSTLVGYGSLYLYLSPNLPSVETLKDVKFKTPLRVYSADNKLIGEYGVRREPIPLAEMSPVLIKAFLAAEDDSFYSHSGVDVGGFVRAVSQYLLQGGSGSGGSTLTMQVAKMCFMVADAALRCSDAQQSNPFLTYDRSLLYKAVQILLAKKIEKELSKDDILEIYLNQIFLGHQSFGIQAAAKTYYNKQANQLNLAEAAVLAGIPPGPSIFNPVSHPERALNRRRIVLRRMLDEDYIDQVQFEEANAQPSTAKFRSTDLDLKARYVSEMAYLHMVNTYGEVESQSAGYRVYTTIDGTLQQAAQRAVINGLIAYDERHGFRPFEARLEPVFYQPSEAEAEPAEEEEFDQTETVVATNTSPILYPESRASRVVNSDKSDKENPTTQQQLHLNPWMEKLKAFPTYAEFRPAAVIRAESFKAQATDEEGNTGEVTEHVIEAVLASGEIISIPWENVPQTAGAYLNVDNYGYPYKDTSFLNVGDVIRVLQQRDRTWKLVQLPEAQAAFVALDPNTGAIKALVGGFDWGQSPFNRVTLAERQPGSNIKPFLYTYALENGYTPATMINDAPYTTGYDPVLETTWNPSNAGDKYFGPIPLRRGFYLSQNVVAVRVLDELRQREGKSLRDFYNSLERFGFDKTEFYDDGLSSALGTQVQKPIDVATAYAALANGGYKVENFIIDRIELEGAGLVYEADYPVVCPECEQRLAEAENKQPESTIDDPIAAAITNKALFDQFAVSGETLETPPPPEPELPTNIAPRIMDERVAFLMYDMMRDVIKVGTATRASAYRAGAAFNRNDLAGKTGTVGDARINPDTWFSGFNRSIVATAWVGMDDNTTLGRHEQGAVTALPIWIEFMRTALRDIPEQAIVQPPGISQVRINPESGLRTYKANGQMEYFLNENIPPFEDNVGPNNLPLNNNNDDPVPSIY